MNYGLYLSASGARASMVRQDVVANNLANAETVGFKPDLVYTYHIQAERPESGAPVQPQELLERLGGGAAVQHTWMSDRQGALVPGRGELDVAIDGEGYFVVLDAGGSALTRDGRFALDEAGELVLASSGLRVAGAGDRPIVLDRASPVTIEASGEVLQGGRTVGVIQLALPPDRLRPVRGGDGLLRLEGGAARHPAPGTLVQGHLESSAVDAVSSLDELIDATRAAQANLRLMQHHDHIMGQAINTVGRIA